MASRRYRINEIVSIDPPVRTIRRRRVRAKITRLEDGRELEVSMLALGKPGEVVSLEDEHVSMGLWHPQKP